MWKIEAHNAKHWGVAPSHTFDELMLKYLEEVQGQKRSEERDMYALKRLKPFFTGCDMRKTRRATYRAYIKKRREDGVKVATISRELDLLSSAINYARHEWEWDIPNHTLCLRLPKSEERVRSLTVAEARRLIAEAEKLRRAPHLVSFIRVALNTGCRKNELLKLQWERVDLKANLILLGERDTKAARRRSVPLNAEARDEMLALAQFRATHCPDSPWVFAHRDGSRLGSVRTAFNTALKKAGIKDFRIHDLRHTCASWLVSSGVSMQAVRDLLGHSTVAMTERYAHLAPESIRAAVAVLDGHAQSGYIGSEDELALAS